MPSGRSWCATIQERTSSSSELDRIFPPSSGWRRIWSRSSSVRGPGFPQDRVGDADLADVVQDPGQADALDAIGGQFELLGHHLAELADRLAVRRGTRVSLVEGFSEAEHGGKVGLSLDVPPAGHLAERPGHLRAVDDGAVAAEHLSVERLVGTEITTARSSP